jgi:uncharacterized protein YjiS (DUF1127 family)
MNRAMDKRRRYDGLTNAEIEILVRRDHFRWRRQWLWTRLRRLAAWLRLQWALRELRRLDDNQLADIGLRRDQLHTRHFRSGK